MNIRQTRILQLSFFAAALLGSFVIHAPAQGLTRKVLTSLDGFNSTLETLKGTITRVDVDNGLGVSDTRKGKLKYAHDKKGNKQKVAVRIDFESPEESIAITGGRYYMYRPGPNQAYEGPVSSQKGSREGVPLAFIGTSRREVEANYTSTYMGRGRLQNGEDATHIKLVPKYNANFEHAEIWVNDAGMPVQSKVVQKVSGDSTTILISNYTKNAKIDGSEFKIIIPKTANRHVEK